MDRRLRRKPLATPAASSGMDMDRSRLAVVLSACLLAALLLADAGLSQAAVVDAPRWAIDAGTVTRGGLPSFQSSCPLGTTCKHGEDWTTFRLLVKAELGQVVQVNDAPMQDLPYALYAFDTTDLPFWMGEDPLSYVHLPSLTLVSDALWNASLLRPSLVRLAPGPAFFNGVEQVAVPTSPMARAERTGSDPGGGILFVWANRTTDQRPAETYAQLGFSKVLAEDITVFHPGLAALHPWLAATEGLAALGLAGAVAWMLGSRRREGSPPTPGEEPLTPAEEMLALLERSEGYLRGLRNIAAAGLAIFALAGLLALAPLAQQVEAVQTLHGHAAAWVVGAGFAAAYAALVLLWGVQLARVSRELRRLRALRTAAGP